MALLRNSVSDTYLARTDELHTSRNLTVKQFLKGLKKKKVILSLNNKAEWIE